MTPSIREIANGCDVDNSESSRLSTTRFEGPEKSTLPSNESLHEKPSLADRAHEELKEMLERCNQHSNHETCTIYREPFPMACKALLHSLPGNWNCIDCNARDPEWAAISYGAMVCIKCSGRHRSLGVAVSQVRSVSMDHWTHREVVLMLEGGNAQLGGFFVRNCLTKIEFEKREKTYKEQQERQEPSGAQRRRSSLTADNVESQRYKTKAAAFYKNQLEAYVGRLLEDPVQKPYQGRLR